jgi:putative sterol carrier protein
MSDLTPSFIFSDKIPAKIASNPDKVRSINAIYQFNISGDMGGEWVLDLTKDSDQVSEGTTDDAKCTVTMKDVDFVSLWSGKLPAQMAFMTGKLKIKGDMSLAMKLTQVIG